MDHEMTPTYGVYTIRRYSKNGQNRNHWLRIGSGFQNKDGSFNIRLRALPIPDQRSGTASLHMRLPKEKLVASRDEEEGFYAEIDPVYGIPLEDL